MQNKLTWEAHEFKTHKKSFLWYLGFIVLSILLLAYAIYTRDILTIITFVLIVLVGFGFSIQQPRKMVYSLSATGIQAGENVYLYRNIKKFWIIYNRENKSLNFETTTILNNQINIQLAKQDPVAVKEFLKKYIPEDLDREESVTDIITRKIKY